MVAMVLCILSSALSLIGLTTELFSVGVGFFFYNSMLGISFLVALIYLAIVIMMFCCTDDKDKHFFNLKYYGRIIAGFMAGLLILVAAGLLFYKRYWDIMKAA